MALLTSCSSEKFLSEGETILSDVKVSSSQEEVGTTTFLPLVGQRPNAKWFNVAKVPLAIYSLSGRDSTKKINRFVRKVGEAPVIYQRALATKSRSDMRQALFNRGYLHADVNLKEKIRKKRVSLNYELIPGNLYSIDSVSWEIENDAVASLLKEKKTLDIFSRGMPCNVGSLENGRSQIIRALQNGGYYAANKELVSFKADTLKSSTNVDLTIALRHKGSQEDSLRSFTPYTIRNVNVFLDVDEADPSQRGELDSISYEGYSFFYSSRRPSITPKRIVRNISLKPGKLYRENDVQATYRDLMRLSILTYANTRFREVKEKKGLLDCDILLRTNKVNTVGFELEGTNTAGDLGIAAAANYSNRNLFRGGELFNLKVRGAFEAIKGLEDYANQDYLGVSVEASLKFPYFIFPFIGSDVRHTSRVTSESSVMYDSQNRPEFHRRVLTAAWKYHWQGAEKKMRHTFDVLDLNYVFMPWISNSFRKNYLDSVDNSRKSVLRYSYENLLIAKMGYNFSYNSLGDKQTPMGLYHTNAYQIKLSIETAGNLLYALSSLLNAEKDNLGHRTLFNVAFAEYAKMDVDFTKSVLIDDRNSLAFHLATGLSVPYGNASVVPYEKRYFSGGANSVRGWSVRELGPGTFRGRNGKTDFINQTGNIKLDLSVEYRTLLFWKLHGAMFVDAGNVWTIRNYPDQSGGVFQFDKFLGQLAVAYGVGLRFNLDYFILRFDGAMKAINPAYSDHIGHYPIVHPKFGRDFTFHFAIGLPF